MPFGIVAYDFVGQPFSKQLYLLNMRTLKFKTQPTNTFFATVIQMFGVSSLLLTTAERALIESNRWAKFRQHSRKLGGAAQHMIDSYEKRFVGWALNFRVRMLLKGAVILRISCVMSELNAHAVSIFYLSTNRCMVSLYGWNDHHKFVFDNFSVM